MTDHYPVDYSKDPTYNINEIKSDPILYAAWIMSECLNDSAPIGWHKYVWIVEELDKNQLIKKNEP